MGEPGGTAFSALRLRTSCSVTPGNSGTCTLRSRPLIEDMPGRAPSSAKSSRCASHRMGSIRTHVRSDVQSQPEAEDDPGLDVEIGATAPLSGRTSRLAEG